MNINLHDSFASHDQSDTIESIRGFLDTASQVPEIQEYNRRIRLHLALQPGETALDVGCGVGHEVCRLALDHPATEVIGLDRETVLTEAARRAAQLGASVHWLVAEAEAIPLPDDSVDACMTERVLKYLPEPELGVREIARVLKPGGRFASFELDYDATVLGGRVDVADRIAEVLRGSVGEARMGRRLPELLADAGMLDINCRPVIFSPPWEIQDAIVGNTVREAIAEGRLPTGPATMWLEQHAMAYRTGLFSVAFVGCLVTGLMPPQ
jgi:SAM-dependent methyltransferase